MASIDLLYETFDLYYKKAKSCYEKGDLFLAKKYYLLAAEQMLKLAKESKDELQNARYKRAKSILAFAESIHIDKKQASENLENEKLPEPNVVKISLEEALNKLYSLEGLSKVKEQVGVWVNQIKAFRLRQERGLPVPEEFTYHLVFRGRAGTGKTTVARLMAQIYGALGILSKGHLIEVHARDLVAGYVGQTAIRTKEYIQQASGGVLFIDEAYYLAQGGANDFGQEAIGVLLKRMEDNRGDFVVIVAGYEDTMDDFISSNSGLKSRFSNFIDFEDYTGAELFNIFKKLCDKYKYEMDYPVQIALRNYFNDLYLNRGKDYANGRDARNLFEKIVSYNSNYVAKLKNPSDKELNLITLSQLPDNIAKYYKNESKNNQVLSINQDVPEEQNQQENQNVNNLNIDEKKQEETLNKNDKSVAEIAENNSKKVFEKINILGAALRPQRLDDFIGQPKAVEALRMPIEKARLTGAVLPHILLCASYGQGKTTLAKIIANEVEGNFIEVVAGIKYRDMLRTLSDIKKGDVIFIDEIHKLSTDVIEQLLYPAMEDFEIHYTEGNGTHLINKTKNINPFTLIGATTETGSLLKPFYSKFKINCTLEEYSLDTIIAIIINSFRHSGLDITVDLAEKIAKRCRLSPRQANAFVEGISSRAIVEAARKKGINKAGALSSFDEIKSLSIQVDEKDIDDYFATMRIDDRGLKEEELKILRLIAIDYKGGPIGVENIAKAMNMAVNRISNEYEPMLIKLGLLGIKNGGRYATDAAYNYLGLTRNADKLNGDELSEKENNVYSE